MVVNFRSFKQKVRRHQKTLKRYLGKIEKNPPPGLDKIAEIIDAEVWKEIDCLSCANCCKSMTPTFTNKDIKRIDYKDKENDQYERNGYLSEELSLEFSILIIIHMKW